MPVLRGCGLPVKLPQQNMRERFGHWCRRGLQEVGNANAYHSAFQTDVAIGIRKPLVLDLDRGRRRARLQLPVHAPEDFPGRFEEERAFDIHGREKITLYLTAIDHNKRLLNFLSDGRQ